MDVEEKLNLFKKWPTEEILTEEDLKELISSGTKLKHYIGFEISGRLHLGSGIGCMLKVVDFQKAGVECNIFLADWHAWINNKLKGNWEYINKAIKYFKEGFIASIKAVGGDPEKLNFVVASELYHNNDDYWKEVIEISKNVSVSRILRSTTILGRKEKEISSFAQLIYPPMQVADIFIQGINISHSGTDQRKIHVIAREVAKKLKVSPLRNNKGEKIKPIAIHHHLWLGLQKPSVWPVPKDKIEFIESIKMSKSKPNTAIFIEDSPEEIKRKIKKAFCPEKEVEFNPIIDIAHSIAFRDGPFRVNRPERYGGEIVLESFDDLTREYSKGNIHPLDLKEAIAEKLIKLLEPVRKHFKGKEDLIKMFENFK